MNKLSLAPDPTALFLTGSVQSALQKIHFLIQKRQGLACIYGEPGTGKTTLLRYIHSRYASSEDFPSIFHTATGERAFVLLNEIAAYFKIAPRRSQPKLLAALEEERLMPLAKEGRCPLLFIDEAHLLWSDHIELLEQLLSYKYRGKRIIQAILAGNLRLPERIAEWTKLPIAAHIALDSLTFGEVKAMLDHRARIEGVDLFLTPAEIERVYTQSAGIPAKALKLVAEVAA